MNAAPAASLATSDVIAFVTVRDAERAKSFYRDVLGLHLAAEELPFALVFDANGTMLRIAIHPEHVPAGGTVLGWQVEDMEATVKDLGARGVLFARWDDLPQDELGIWNSPGGARVAWFKDPDGNVLSLTQFPDSQHTA